MDSLTAMLKKSIRYENSKTDLTNLLNHNQHDLCVAIEAFEFLMRDYQNEITIKEGILRESEDLSEKVRKNLEASVSWRKDQVQSLIAWRALFFTAIERIK